MSLGQVSSCVYQVSCVSLGQVSLGQVSLGQVSLGQVSLLASRGMDTFESVWRYMVRTVLGDTAARTCAHLGIAILS